MIYQTIGINYQMQKDYNIRSGKLKNQLQEKKRSWTL